MSSIYTWLTGASQPIAPDFGSPMINGEESPLVKKVLDLVKNFPDFLTESPPGCYQLRKALIAHQVSPNHPLIVEIDRLWGDSSIKRGDLLPGLLHPPMSSIYFPLDVSRITPANTVNTEEKRKFVTRPSETTEEVLGRLDGYVGELDEIELASGNDAVIEKIVEKFPNLTALRIKARIDAGFDINDTIGDVGLQQIGKLQNLKIFEWDYWDNFAIYPESFAKLLANLHLKNQLIELKIVHFYVMDSLLQELAGCKKLEKLHLGSCWAKKYDEMLQSPSLQSSLMRLNISSSSGQGVTILTDPLFASLSACQRLEELLLKSAPASGKLSELGLQKCLEAQSQLKVFSLEGVRFSDETAEKVGAMPFLEKLHLQDCEPLRENGYEALLRNKEHLTHLSLKNCTLLGVDDQKALKAISELPALEHLSLRASWISQNFSSLFSSEKIKSQLKSLALEDLSGVRSAEFKCLRQLLCLKTLRIENCRWFNDEALGPLIDSRLKNTLSNVQLDKVSLTDNAIPLLVRVENLKHLLLGSCFAFSENSYRQFLKKFTGLETLAVDNFPFTDQDVEKFKAFSSLKGLLIWNTDFSQDALRRLFDIGKGRNWQLMVAEGEDDDSFINTFETAIADETHF